MPKFKEGTKLPEDGGRQGTPAELAACGQHPGQGGAGKVGI